MSSPIVPLMFVGAGVYLLSQRKGRARGGAYNVSESLPKEFIETGASSNWQQRQQALEALSGVSFNLRDGRSVAICSRCNPGRTDGAVDEATTNAVKAFQAFAGLPVTGEWGSAEDQTMARTLRAIAANEPIFCDPTGQYPIPLHCGELPGKEGSYLFERTDEETTIQEQWETGSGEWGPDDILVADPECNYIIHQSDDFTQIQKRLIIEYALDGADDLGSAEEIHELMMAEYLPLCLTLGYDGVGEGMQTWWNTNVVRIMSDLKTYSTLPELLEEDAIAYGIL